MLPGGVLGTSASRKKGDQVRRNSIFTKRWVKGSAVLVATAATLVFANPQQAIATPLKGVDSATVSQSASNVVDIDFADGIKGRITFLEDGIFRYNVDPKGEFSDYATPRSKSHTAKIQAQPDTSDTYSKPSATVADKGDTIEITGGKATVILDKATGKMSIKSGDRVVVSESASLDLDKKGTVQTLAKEKSENFFGGGTQNGRFLHTNQTIAISNTNNWTDGGVASPNPFYWTSDGYGVLRNTFAEGSYDFGSTDSSTVTTLHSENEFDAYYFVATNEGASNVATEMLQDYYKVTGNPVLLPEYGFYLGHLNAYNRDGWSTTSGQKKWETKGSKSSSEKGDVKYESGMSTGYKLDGTLAAETLNGEGPTVDAENMKATDFDRQFSARQVIDDYEDNDMPLGWFLPNDGYGAGYGQNGYYKTGGVNSDGASSADRLNAVRANVDNLKKFTEYANSKGVSTGLWTQSNLEPDSNPETPWHLLRDFDAEVKTGGITTLKTDVAWVGSGYSFGLNGIKTAYDTVTTGANKRPNIITLDGWAGTQRFGGIWTGDQYGGNWEYIRFHIPTSIGQSLSGNPNIGSDMDGIFGGDPIISARDYQWKTFTPSMLDMDGWGTYRKSPMTHGDPYTGISRFYLKLKAQLMPYIYTSAASAANIDTGNGDAGLPMIRAMLLSDNSEYAASTSTQYQYMFGENFLVAPVYQDTQADENGNDIRNGIYLPNYGTDENPTIWIDYFSGKQYRGGQVLNNYEAPLWKLPLFVKANAIVPMYAENNNPEAVSDTNTKGTDRSQRIVEFFATEGDGTFTQYEDDGSSIENNTTEDDSYGTIDNISYGEHVSTVYRSKAAGGTATFTAEASQGGYNGYDSNRTTTFVANVSAKPMSVVAKNGGSALNVVEVDSQETFDTATPEAGQAVYFYSETPNLNHYGSDVDGTEAERGESFNNTKITTNPKVYVKFAKTDVAAAAQTLELGGFVNADATLTADRLNESLSAPTNLAAPEDVTTPTSIKLTWGKVDGATSYDLKVDGTVFAVGDAAEFTHTDLAYNSKHTYQIRSRNAEGYSAWSDVLEANSALDPWRNVPDAEQITWEGSLYGSHKAELAFDHEFQSGDGGFHSGGNDLGKALTVDYGRAYKLDKLEYYPRDDAGNGTVTKMRVETSLDGVHWTSQEVDWARSADCKTVAFDGTVAARYVRMTPLASVGNFFSASEIAIYKTDGTDGFAVGSNLNKATISDGDYSNMKNYLGLENREPDTPTFGSQIRDHFADLNDNGVYDVYDYSFTMAGLDGGTKQKGKVAGSLAVIPSKTEVEAGDEITVDVYAADAKNVNALGALVNFKSDQFEFVSESIAQDGSTAGMENLSREKVQFADRTQTINLAFANRGDGKLYNGTGAVASFKLKAKTAGKVELPSTSWLIGPACDALEFASDGTVTMPDVPQPTVAEYGQDAFNITMTNDELTTDDGTNVEKLIQQKSYNALFDNNEGDNGFEFLWNWNANWDSEGKLPSYVKLPTTMTFAFKTPSKLDSVEVVNRNGGNGTVQKIKAVVTFEDGSTQEFAGGEYDSFRARYAFGFSAENKGKKATKVEVTPLEASGDQMLTLREVNFNYTQGVEAIEGVELGKNQTEFFEGDVTLVDAKATPESAGYPYVTVESSDPSVVSVSAVQAGDSVSYYLRANKAGKATITVASVLDPSKTASYEVEVKAGVDTSALVAALSKAAGYSESVYTKDSYAAITTAVEAAQKLLDGGQGSYSKKDVADATVKIEKAIDGLKMRPVDEKILINTPENRKNVKVARFSSEADYEGSNAVNALDGDERTLWHSDWAHGTGMPQYLSVDLGRDYDLTDVTFLPRQDGGTNGDIFEAEILVSDTADGYEMGTAASMGTFAFDNDGRVLTDRGDWKQMSFGAARGRYVTVKVIHAGGGDVDAYCSMAELKFYGTAVLDPVAKDDLATAIEKVDAEVAAGDLKAGDYTEASWTALENALASARAILSDENATQDEVDQALRALESARGALEKTPVAPVENPTKKQLKALVKQAKETDTRGKTAESVKALTDAITYAEDVLGDENASDTQIQAAYGQLKLAIESLKDADSGNQGGSGNQGSGNGSNGGNQAGKPAGDKAQGSKKNGSAIPNTGDQTAATVATVGGLGAIIAAIGAFFHRRSKAK